ncbi:MAG: BLUF domain-containing protein [Pedobacter sp.]|nr:MAG: BLUF domain-containing protein [Pedobacter sp.]
MKYLIYISTASKIMVEDDLKEILNISQQNNKKNNLTGMLLYGEGSFVQLLEGDADQLDETYNTILTDERHKNVFKLDEGDIEARFFPDWTMGFKVISGQDMSEFEGYADTASVKQWDGKGYHPVLEILKNFADINNL